MSSACQRSRSRAAIHAGAKRSGDCSAHDRWVEADREGIGADGGQAGRLGGDTADADEPRERDRPCRNGRDLEPVDGEAVVEARGAKPREERVVEPLGTSEDDRLDHRPALPAQAEGRVAGEPALQQVSGAADPATAPDDARFLRAQHDVHSLPSKPRRLVEAVLRTVRELEDPDHAQASALRRRAAGRQLEQHGLMRAKLSPPGDERSDAHVELPDTRWLLRFDDCPLRLADVRKQDAAVERVQPVAPPPPAGRREHAGCARTREDRDGRQRREADDVRGGEAGA